MTSKMLRRGMSLLLIRALFIIGVLASAPLYAEDYSLVINHGRVIDSEMGLDAIRHLGISQGEIVTVSEQPLQADRDWLSVQFRSGHSFPGP
ncbi:MAG: hypothetical protein ACI9GW_002384 [Halieaceae bacterium]|jgi:hypothetical protein